MALRQEADDATQPGPVGLGWVGRSPLSFVGGLNLPVGALPHMRGKGFEGRGGKWPFPVQASVQQLGVSLPVGRVAAAGRGFQAGAVQHRHIAAVVFDEAAALQGIGGSRDADPAHAQHIGQEFVRHVEVVGMRAVLAHQQPAGQALGGLVKAQAGGRSGLLRHQHIEVTVHAALQRQAARQLEPEGRCADSPGSPGPLHHRMQRRGDDAQRELRAQHAFAAHHADFHPGAAFDQGHQRDEAVDGEVDVARGFARLAEHLGQHEFYRLADSQQAQAVLAGKALDEVVFDRGQNGSPVKNLFTA